jgi:hypothetical protein
VYIYIYTCVRDARIQWHIFGCGVVGGGDEARELCTAKDGAGWPYECILLRCETPKYWTPSIAETLSVCFESLGVPNLFRNKRSSLFEF